MQHYWKGNYELSEHRLSKALSLCPEAILNSAFEGYLGLSLYRLGKTANAKKHLVSAQSYLAKSSQTDNSIIEVEKSLSKEKYLRS